MSAHLKEPKVFLIYGVMGNTTSSTSMPVSTVDPFTLKPNCLWEHSLAARTTPASLLLRSFLNTFPTVSMDGRYANNSSDSSPSKRANDGTLICVPRLGCFRPLQGHEYSHVPWLGPVSSEICLYLSRYRVSF